MCGSFGRVSKKRPSGRRLDSIAGSAKGLQVRQLASSASSKREDVVDGQVFRRSALGTVRLLSELHAGQALPPSVVASLRSRTSALALGPFVLAQAVAAAATAVAVGLVVAAASVAEADLHLTPAGAQNSCATSAIMSRRGEVSSFFISWRLYRSARMIRNVGSTLENVQAAELVGDEHRIALRVGLPGKLVRHRARVRTAPRTRPEAGRRRRRLVRSKESTLASRRIARR